MTADRQPAAAPVAGRTSVHLAGPAPAPPAPFLSIIVPAYNEAPRFEAGVHRLSEAMAEGAVDPRETELIVVDDGSSDGTGGRAMDILGTLPEAPAHDLVLLPSNRGKGAAIRAGVSRARGATIAYLDADMAIHPRQLPALLAALEHAEVAIGSRAVGANQVVYANRRRTLEGRAFNRLVNLVVGVGLDDTQCGFKAFRAPAARLLFACSTIDRFAFDAELLANARRLGLRVAEVAVEWRDVPGSRIRPVADPVSMIFDLLRSRTGLRRPRPIPALEVTGDVGAVRRWAGGDAAEPPATVRGPGTGLEPARRLAAVSVVAEAQGTVLVLLPWADDASVDELAAGWAVSVPGTAVRRRTLSLADLRALAPLRLTAPGLPG